MTESNGVCASHRAHHSFYQNGMLTQPIYDGDSRDYQGGNNTSNNNPCRWIILAQ